MVDVMEVKFGLTWLDTVSEVIVLNTVPVIVVVNGMFAVQTPEPHVCPPRQQPPTQMMSFFDRVQIYGRTYLPDSKDRRTTLDRILLSRWWK